MTHLGHPLGLDVLEGARRRDGGTDEENVRFWVRERPQAVVVLRPGCVPLCSSERKQVNPFSKDTGQRTSTQMGTWQSQQR